MFLVVMINISVMVISVIFDMGEIFVILVVCATIMFVRSS